MREPFFDPKKTYYENWEQGPFSDFADRKQYGEYGAEPEFNFLGEKIAYPLGIPAGPLLNDRFVNAALDKGFDVPVHKTVRSRTYDCNPFPNVLGAHISGDLTLEMAQSPIVVTPEYREPLSITNSFGNPSFEPSVWQAGLRTSLQHARKGQLVMSSFEGTPWPGETSEDYIADWVRGMLMLKDAGIKIVEANFSCPNEGHAQLLCFDVQKVVTISHAIKNAIGDTKLIIKLAYFLPDQLDELVRETSSIVDGYAAINTIPAAVVNPDGTQALPGGEKRKKSGICGAAIKWAGIDMVQRLAELREKRGASFGIVGSGGVMVPDDFKAYRNAGADVVMSATGAMWNPLLAVEIKEKYPHA